jgi:hypothetical protein
MRPTKAQIEAEAKRLWAVYCAADYALCYGVRQDWEYIAERYPGAQCIRAIARESLAAKAERDELWTALYSATGDSRYITRIGIKGTRKGRK